MKFGGLFDCAKPKIHGLGLLIYDNVASDIEAAFSEMETNYEDFVNIEGTIVNPLNYAPPSELCSWMMLRPLNYAPELCSAL